MSCTFGRDLAWRSLRGCFAVLLVVGTAQGQVCPRLVGSAEYPEDPPWPRQGAGVVVADGRAIVAVGRGLLVFDVAKPESPELLGYWDSPGSARSVEVSGDFAYVADSSAGVRIVDVSKPYAPAEVGYYQTTGHARDVAMAGELLLVANGNSTIGLVVLDVSDPARPFAVGELATPMEAAAVGYSGGHALIGLEGSFCAHGGLLIADMSEPTQPKQIGYYEAGGCVDWFTGTGDTVYLSRIWYLHYPVLLFRILDLSKPAAPLLLSSLWVFGGGMAADGNVLFVAGGPTVIDVSLPTEPVVIHSPPTDDFAQAVSISEGYAYVTGLERALDIYDIVPCMTSVVFADGFESGDVSGWAVSLP